MYNFLSRHRKVIKWVIWVAIFFTGGILLYFSPCIFSKENVYFYTLSTIVQGFVALVAFLGAVVVFKIQLEDQAMQKLSDNIEDVIDEYDSAARTYTPTQMMSACEKIIREKDKEDTVFIRRFYGKMKETSQSRDEARNAMVDFATISLFNVAVALLSLLFTPILITYWRVGGVLLVTNVALSIFSLSLALQVVRRAIGYKFSITL